MERDRTTLRTSDVPLRRPSGTAPGVPTMIRDERVRPLPSATPLLRPGSMLGRYVVHRAVGRGGMGVVYGGVDPQLGRRVAIKLVRDDGKPAARFHDRLQREALALARLCHPNIVVLFDIGRTEQGTFVAMEYVRGLNLRRWLRLEPRSVDQIIRVFSEAARGLAAAHEAGLVHRDFKPSNVMVTMDDRVKVLDFGLARGTPSDDPWLAGTKEGLLSRRMTRADTVVGTTGYMPPEQLLGRQVSAASDQFAFCVALFEALHGARPFPGKTPVEQARTYASGLRNEVAQRRDVPPRVRRALERGMSLQVEERYPSMADLLADLAPSPTRNHLRTAAGVLVLAATAWASSAATQWFQHPPASAVAPSSASCASSLAPTP